MNNYTTNIIKNQVLYVIHGWTYTIEPWTKTIEQLQKAGIKVKMLRVPGLTEPSRKIWTIEQYVEWADQQIPDGAIALGHSNGGRILLNLCSKNPLKLHHLILLNSAGVYEPSKKRNLLRLLAKIGAPLKKIRLLRKLLHKLIGASDYSRAPENMKQTLANMLESDRSLDLAQISTPTTILWGKDDTVTPPRQARVLHQKISDSHLLLRSGWTHAPYISDPSGLAASIIQVLKGLV